MHLLQQRAYLSPGRQFRKITHKNENQEHKAYYIVNETLFLRELEKNQASLALGLNFSP